VSFKSLAAQRGDHPETNQFRIGAGKDGVTFKLPLNAAQKLGWTKGTKLDVQPGDGDDAGAVRLCADPKGWSLIAAGASSKGLRLQIRSPALAAPERFPSQAVRHVLEGTTAIIAWLPWGAGPASADHTAAGGDAVLQGPTQASPAASDAGSGGNPGVANDPPAAGREDRQHAGSGEEPAADAQPGVSDQGAHGDIIQSGGVSVGSIPTSGTIKHPGAGAEPASVAMGREVEASETGDPTGEGRTAGSIPATGASGKPPVERTAAFPVQERSLADVAEPPPSASPPRSAFAPPEEGAYGRMSAEQTERFVQAAARDATLAELTAILAQPPGRYASGSVYWFRDTKLAHRVEVARKRIAAQLSETILPPPAPDPEQAAIDKFIAERGVKIVMAPERVAELLRDAGRQVTIRETDSVKFGNGFKRIRVPVIDGKECTLAELYGAANVLRAKAGLPELSLPVDAAAAATAAPAP